MIILKIFPFALSLLLLGFTNNTQPFDLPLKEKNISSKFSLLSENEKTEFISALQSGNCEFKGIKLYGKVQFVEHFPDIKIQFVKHFPDIKVKFVEHFPDKCGLWKKVEHFPDFKVQVVEHFPDIKIQTVEHFPGMNK